MSYKTYEIIHRDKKCCECGGSGKILRTVPRFAIAMPGVTGDWKRELQCCWRCHGDGIGRSFNSKVVEVL